MNNKKGVKLLAAAMVMVMAFAAVAVFASASDVDSDPVYTESNTVATVGTAADFATALGNATVTKIVLSDDFSLGATTIDRSITIDGNKHTITLTGDIKVTAVGTVTFSNMTMADSGSTDHQILVSQGSTGVVLNIDNCTFTGSITGDDDRTMFIADGKVSVTNTNFNDKKLTITGSAKKVTVRNCSNVYLNFGVNATFDAGSTSGTAVVDIDSATSIYGIKPYQNTTLDLGNTTIVAEKLFVKTGVTLQNGTITADIVKYEDTPAPAITVSDVTLLGNNKIDVAITVKADTEFTISGQVTIESGGSITAQAGATFINNNDAPGSNALPVSGNASGEGWSLENDILTLNGYNGSNVFKGEFTDVILIGDNTITLDADKDGIIAIESTELKNISTLATGEGSLSITISGEFAKQAIKTTSSDVGNTLTINGVVINIDISNDAEESTEKYAIDSSLETIDIAFSDITIVMDDEDEKYCAFKGTVAVKIFRSSIDIAVPSVGIETPKLTVAESDISVDAGKGAIKAGASDISNQSKINISSTKGYAFEGAFKITQGSEIVASSMKITDDTTNYATVTNNGNMVIVYDKTFTNNSSFVNNGIVGVYGTFENAVGETVNNGEINTYGYDSKQAVEAKVFGLGENSATIAFAKPVALADGKYSIVLTVTGEETKPYNGTLTYTSDKIIINAVNTSGKISITATLNDAGSVVEKYTVTVTSKNLYVTEKTADGDATYEVTNKNNLYALFDLAKTSVDQFIILTGGKIANNGSFTLNTVQTASQKEFIQAGEFVNAGDLTFNDNVKMAAGKLSGNDVAIGAGVAVELNGDVDAAFVYAGEYTYFDDEAEKDVTVQFDNEISIVGDCVGVAFSTQAGSAINNAVFINTANGAATDKTVKVTVVKGTLVANGETTVFKDDVTVDVLSGATFEAKGTVNVGSGVLAAQDGSILNIKGDDVESYTYGELVYTISFVKGGYTYYGDLVYALANATEGMKLTLTGTTTVIKDDLVVGKGVTLEFAKKATLALGTTTKVITISMLEGASFIFTDENNKITIANQGATVSGTFTYDGNTVVLDKVLLDNGSDKIEAVKATKTDASRIAITVTNALKDGKITSAAGIVSVNATFDKDAVKKTASKLAVSEGTTVISGTATLNSGSFVTVDGTLVINNTATISATVDGSGTIALADAVGVTFDETIAQNITVTNKAGTDKVTFIKMTSNKSGNTNSVVITSVKATGSKAAYMDISGKYYSGTIQVDGNAGLSALTVDTKAVLDVPAGSTVTVLTESTVVGLVKVAGTINMRVTDDPATVSYAALKYDITYADGNYTVYTIVSTAVANATAGDSFTLTKDLEVDTKLEVPSGVTIVVPEKYKIVVGSGEYLVLGSGITTLGATGGIDGTVELTGSAYVIAYADSSMDNSKMKIVSSVTTEKIVNSQITVINQLYATIYAIKNNANLTTVLDNVEIEITGYRFVEFTDTVGEDVAGYVGDEDVIAEMLPSQVQVTFTKVEGISYYVNNTKMNIVGAPVYVAYGTTVTAVADYGYDGTPLVNGKAYITVDNTTTTITGSGVSPASAPETSSDSGMGITDYLLIVLVILAAILVVIVAIRMMRS